jgi:endoglucanase
MIELLRELCGTFGPSGEEEAVAALVRRRVKAAVPEITGDAMGNVFARRPGKGARVMLAAHMDEIGLILSHVDERGFARFSNIGGLRLDLAANQRVRLKSGRVGVIMEEERGSKDDRKIDRLFIDFGFESGAAARKEIQVGDVACFDRTLEVQGNRAISKAMDDRVSCAVLIEAARRLKKSPNDVTFAFTVQEEVGCRGALPAAYTLNPDVALSVDVTLSGDVPECRPMAVALGAGPAIKVKDGGHIAHPKVRDLLVSLARKFKLKHQMEVLTLDGATTDAASIHRVREGVPTGCVSIPCRYVHTVSEMVDLRDVEGAVRLLVAFLETDLGKAGF